MSDFLWLIDIVRGFGSRSKEAGRLAGLHAWNGDLTEGDAKSFLEDAKKEGVEIDEEEFWRSYNS
jgi:hypothetical protein